MNRYKVLERIGQGAHGYVVKGEDLLTHRTVAMKKLIIKNLHEGIPKNVMREINTLKVLNHDHIVAILDVVPHGMSLILVMEYLPTNLHLITKQLGDDLNVPRIKAYLIMLLEGVHYMHSNHIMHRDLKPTNLLISQEGTLKIGDFGLARIYVEDDPNRLYSHQVATRWYRAPELLYGARKYDKTIDMWAVGCIAGELINKAPLFPGETDIEQLAIVLHNLGTPNADIWPGHTELPDYNKITFARNPGLSWQTILPNTSTETRNFVKSLIVYNPLKRISAKQALKHKFFMEKPVACKWKDLPRGTQNSSSQTLQIDDVLTEFDKILKDF